MVQVHVVASGEHLGDVAAPSVGTDDALKAFLRGWSPGSSEAPESKGTAA